MGGGPGPGALGGRAEIRQGGEGAAQGRWSPIRNGCVSPPAPSDLSDMVTTARPTEQLGIGGGRVWRWQCSRRAVLSIGP